MPDFRKETIYFIVIDRFFDGDPSNDLGKEQDHDPKRADWWKYWGGDLRGILEKLDYLQAVGATSLWVTPVFDQVDELLDAGGSKMAPYHGYWAKDFKRLDEHLVDHPDEVRVFSRSDTIFDKLVAEMHRRGMKLILDIVCNHSNPHVGGHRGVLYDDGKLIASHSTDDGSWYRHEGGVEDWSDLSQVQNRDLCGLADFNEESFEYRSYIKDAMRGWLDKGVDAFRVDTVKHMPLWFWQEFTGDMRVHRPELFMFGEWFQGGCYDPVSVEFANKSGMSLLDFSLRNAIVSTLANRSPRGFEELAAVFEKDELYRDASDLVTFVDNHDMPRFLSISDDPARFRLAVLFTLVARGIPCLYYGGEQLLHCDDNGGNDPYNRPMMTSFETTPLSRDIAALAALRARSPAIQKGGMRTKWLGPDTYVFTRVYEGAACLVGMHRGDASVELEVKHLELADGAYADLLGGPPLVVTGGNAMVRIAARGMAVFEQPPPSIAAAEGHRTPIDLQLHGLRTAFGEEVYVIGDAPELGGWDVRRARKMEFVNRATWAVTIPFEASVGGDIHYKFAVKRGARFDREPGRGHLRRVPRDATLWHDEWRG